MKQNVLVSACLLGLPCRYDGKSKPCKDLEKIFSFITPIPVCPEQFGGLSTPRPPSEIIGNQVINRLGTDVTEQYRKGAEAALLIAKLGNCRVAILKESSPSCGSSFIHNGKFDGGILSGEGITAALLRKNGIEVYSEKEIDLLLQKLQKER